LVRGHWWARQFPALVIAASGVVGCGSTADDTDGAAATDVTTPSTPSDSVAPPTGEPILLAQANQENSPQGSVPDARRAAEAAIAYINEDLGGVHGRPLELRSCITSGSPESSVACANELIALEPVAFIGGADFFSFASQPLYGASGIPVVGGPAFGEADMTAENTFKFFGFGASNWPAMAGYAIEELGAETIAVVFPDNVPGTSTVDAYLEPVITALGATATRVPFAPDTTDFVPVISDAVAGPPDAIIAITPTHVCPGMLRAVQTVGVDAHLFTSTVCAEPSTIEQVGEDALVGAYTVSAFDSHDDSEAAITYREAIQRYLDDDALDEIGVATFSSVMNLYAILTELDPDEVDPVSISEALRSTSDQPSFMGHPYTCDGHQLPGRQAVCDTHSRVFRFLEELEREFVTDWVDHSDLIPPP